MKLLHYTFRRISVLLFLLMSVWGVFFYYAILEEVTDETDDSLENYRNIIVRSALRDSTVLDTRVILKKSFRPLGRLLEWLGEVQPGKEVPPLGNDTKIQEFTKLSEAAVDMSNRSCKAYQEQKQFIENASHELQTPLAIVCGKVKLKEIIKNSTFIFLPTENC